MIALKKLIALQVLQEILRIQRKRQALLQALYKLSWIVANEDEDLEYGRVSKAKDGGNVIFSPWQQIKNIQLQEALLSICATVCNTMISRDEDLALSDKIVVGHSHICFDTPKPVKSLPALVKEAQEQLEKDKKILEPELQKFLQKGNKAEVSVVGPASDLLLPPKVVLKTIGIDKT